MSYNNPYFSTPQDQVYGRPGYGQQMYQQPMQQMYQQPAMQDGMVQARFVSGREEAVAANVIPGSMCLFIDRANRKIYSKFIDPQTGMPEFRDFGETQPAQQLQYVTAEDLANLEQRIEQRLASMQAKPTGRKAATANDE